MEEAQKVPWYAGMKVRWMSRKPHYRPRNMDTSGRGRIKDAGFEVTEITRGQVFEPSEPEYNGIWDLVEVMGESLRTSGAEASEAEQAA